MEACMDEIKCEMMKSKKSFLMGGYYSHIIFFNWMKPIWYNRLGGFYFNIDEVDPSNISLNNI